MQSYISAIMPRIHHLAHAMAEQETARLPLTPRPPCESFRTTHQVPDRTWQRSSSSLPGQYHHGPTGTRKQKCRGERAGRPLREGRSRVGDHQLRGQAGSEEEVHQEGNIAVERGYRREKPGKEDFPATDTIVRPRIRSKLRTAPKVVAVRYIWLLSGRGMIAPTLKERWGCVDRDAC